MKFNFFVFFVILLLPMSCSEDRESSKVDMNFSLTYNGQPLVAFEELDYEEGYKVFFTKYSLFLSEIYLHQGTDQYLLSDVEFIDLLTGINDLTQASRGITISYSDVPVGIFDAISFNIGVPPDLNQTKPADYNPSNPLSNNAEYWEGWSSYIFHKIEGKMDTDGDDDPETGIALHIGSDQAFRNVQRDILLIIDDEREVIKINFELAEILNLENGFYDFLETPQIHHLGILPKALPLLDNTTENLSIVQE